MEKQPPSIATWEALIEERIQAAQAAGQFANLPGLGKPSPLIDQPYRENWWIERKLQREGFSQLPLSLELRRDVEKALMGLWSLPDEASVRHTVTALNEKIRAANYRCVQGPPSFTPLVELDWALGEWRRRRAEAESAS